MALRQYLRRALLAGLIPLGILALVCEALAAIVLVRFALALLGILVHF